MLKGFDHLVVLVQDLDKGSRDFEEMGFTVVPGGRHGSGTHNALIAFDDGSYIELIAFYQPNEAHRWWKWKVSGGGFIDYCMRSSNLDEDLAAFSAAGVVYGAPYQLTRKRPDGYELDWEIAVPQDPRLSGAPFLIRDKTPRGERAPVYTAHPNGVQRIRRMVHAVQNIDLVDAWAGPLQGAQSQPVIRPDLMARGLRATVAVGDKTASTVDFLAPDLEKSPLTAALLEHGAAPYALEFSGSDASIRFDAKQSHGARFIMASENS